MEYGWRNCIGTFMRNWHKDKPRRCLDRVIWGMLCVMAISCQVSDIFSRHVYIVIVIVLLARLCTEPEQLKRILRNLQPMYCLAAILCIALTGSLFLTGNGLELFKTVDYPVYHVFQGIIIALAMFTSVNYEKQIKMILCCALTGVMIASAYAIYNYEPIAGRVSAVGFFWRFGPNTAAMMSAMTIPVLAAYLIRHPLTRIARWLVMIALLVSTVALLVTESRGGWLAAIIASMAVFAFNFVEYKKRILKLSVICICMIAMFVFCGNLTSRLASIVDMQEQAHTERVLMWHSAWNMFQDYPLKGVGLGNYAEAYQNRYILPEAREPHIGMAHNNIMQMLGECGLLGTIPFLLFFGYVLFWAWKCRHTLAGQCVMGITLVVQLHGMVDGSFTVLPVMRWYWLLLAIFFRLHFLEFEKDKSLI